MICSGRVMFAAVVAAVLLLYSTDCFAAAQMDRTAMECCASMPCTPANQSHDCCKTMTMEAAPYLVPAAAYSAAIPLVDLGDVPAVDLAQSLPAARAVNLLTLANEHAPPSDLPTIYHSFLI
jgi:hypothetical protein